MIRIRPYLLLFVAGGLVLSLCDRVHIAYGVLEQADRSFFGQAWWVPLVFGIASVLAPLAYPPVRRLLGISAPPRPRDPIRLGSSALVLCAAYVVTGPMHHSGSSLAVGLTAAWAVRAALRRTRSETVFAVLLAIVGPLVEASLSALGLFTYRQPDVLGVPIWLGAIYLHAGPLVGEIDAYLHRAS